MCEKIAGFSEKRILNLEKAKRLIRKGE